jgi:hypothetical protein
MAEWRQKLRGTTLQLDQTIGLEGLLAYDTEKNNLRVYDGIVLGGYAIPNAAEIAALYTLPTRLHEQGINLEGAGRSANEALLNGWYYTDSATTDQPEAGAASIRVGTVNEGTVITQLWTRGSNGNSYTRVRSSAGVWSAWNRVVDQTYLTTNAAAKAYDADRLDGQDSAYYTAIATRLGYTPANKAGDTFTGQVTVPSLVVTGDQTVGDDFGVTGDATIGNTLTVNGNLITVVGTTPAIYLKDSTASADDFWLYADSNTFYVLSDRNDDAAWDNQHPLSLDNDTLIGRLYGNIIWHVGNDGPGSGLDADTVDGLQGSALARATTDIAAGNGLTGGGELGAAGGTVTIHVGTPSNITNSTTNSVTADSHTHALGFTAAEVYTGSSATETNYGLGHTVLMYCDGSAAIPLNASAVPCLSTNGNNFVRRQGTANAGTAFSGTYRGRGQQAFDWALMERTA